MDSFRVPEEIEPSSYWSTVAGRLRHLDLTVDSTDNVDVHEAYQSPKKPFENDCLYQFLLEATLT